MPAHGGDDQGGGASQELREESREKSRQLFELCEKDGVLLYTTEYEKRGSNTLSGKYMLAQRRRVRIDWNLDLRFEGERL